MKINQNIEEVLYRLSLSKFRSSFHLQKNMIAYIDKNGMNKVKEHAKVFIINKLRPKYPINDGKQTPMKNHPVFIAMHACACCCRNCLFKWHHIPKGRELSNDEMNYIYILLITWIEKELLRRSNKKKRKNKNDIII